MNQLEAMLLIFFATLLLFAVIRKILVSQRQKKLIQKLREGTEIVLSRHYSKPIVYPTSFPEPDQEPPPNPFVFLHIGRVDAYQFRHKTGEDWLLVSCHITSALSKDLVFKRATARLIFSGWIWSEQTELFHGIIKKRTSDIIYFKIHLGYGIPPQIRNSLENKQEVWMRLRIIFWDDRGGIFSLSDEQVIIVTG